MFLTEVIKTGLPFKHRSMDRWYTWDERKRCLRGVEDSRALITITVEMATSREWEISSEWLPLPVSFSGQVEAGYAC